MSDSELYEFDSYRVDPADHRLLRDGAPVQLEPKVFDTLVTLLRHRGRLVGKQELLQAVWPDTFVEEGNLTRNISILRKALARGDGRPQYIETVPKRGYRFVGDVRAPAGERSELLVESARVSIVVEDEECEPGMETGGSARPGGGDAPSRSAGSQKRPPRFGPLTRPKLGLLFSLPALLAAVTAALYLRSCGGSGQAVGSLAVLPFANVGADPDAEYLSDGVTDGLINSLSRLPNLKVMSRSAVFRFRGQGVDAKAAGRQLGVQAVLTGTLTRRGSDLVVSAELVAVRDNSHLWGERYERKLTGLLAAQAQLADDISHYLRPELKGDAQKGLARRETDDPEAYELYLKGRYALDTLTEQQQTSLEYFRRAIKEDPRFARAYAGMAEAHAEMGNLGATFVLPPREAYSLAKSAALKAVELDDTLAEAHAALGQIAMDFEWDWEGAERRFKRAIGLNPNYANARHWYSHYLISMGRFDDSLAESRQALALDPLDAGMNFHLGFHYYNARQYGQAEAQLRKALEIDRNHSGAHDILGLVYGRQKRYQEAVAEMLRSRELGGMDNRGSLGHLYAVSGRTGEARRLLEQLQLEARHKPVSSYGIARVYAGLGETDQAFGWLDKAVVERDGNFSNPGIKVDHDFDPLRSDPRFAGLLRRMGLAQ